MYSAKLFGDINIRTYRGASLVELLHTATLVHDDVVDDSFQRRGFFSINALWKNKIAVLVGDYLLSRGLLLAVEHRDFDMLEIVSNAVRDMSEGELLQLERARFMNATEEVYFQIIKQKTASSLHLAAKWAPPPPLKIPKYRKNASVWRSHRFGIPNPRRSF